jgi:hypothetical protein
VVLGDGSVVVEEAEGEIDPTPFAAAIELAPPYRVEALRRGGDGWAVGARSILALELPGVQGSELEVVWDGSERSTHVDGEPTLGSVPELERAASSRHDTWVVRAHRLTGDVWEVAISPL